jgi:hypothetical protein
MLPQVDALGRVYTIFNGTPVSWMRGIGYDAQGRMCVITALPNPAFFVNGFTLDTLGRVFIVPTPGPTLAFVGGLPFNSGPPGAGGLVSQADQVPLASDAYVGGGIRVNPALGMHRTTAMPPGVFSGFSDGFSDGFGG